MSTPYTPNARKNKLVNPGSNKEGTLSKSDISRILPRQISTGTMRGTQLVTGVFQMNDTQNVPRMIIDAPNSVIKISKIGINVLTASDEQLVFNSNQNIYKIVAKDVNTLVNDGSTQTVLTIPHNLGFVPIALCFLNNSTIGTIGTNLSLQLPTFTEASIGGVTAGVVTFAAYLFSVVDQTNLDIVLFNATGAPKSYDITYYLLQETAN